MIGNGRFPLTRSRFKTFSFLCTLFAMSQSPEEITTFTRRELIELIVLFVIGSAVILIMITYDTRQLTGAFYSLFRSIKFFSQAKKQTRFPSVQKVSFVLGLNWLLLMLILLVFELNHQLALFAPNILLRWQNSLLLLITLMFINESIYDLIRAKHQEDKLWFKWAIVGKLIALISVLIIFIWLNIGSTEPPSQIMVFLLVSPLLVGLAVWWFAHRRQPKESTESVSSV